MMFIILIKKGLEKYIIGVKIFDNGEKSEALLMQRDQTILLRFDNSYSSAYISKNFNDCIVENLDRMTGKDFMIL